MKLADWNEALKWVEDSRHAPVNGCVNKTSTRMSSIAQHIRSLLSTDPVESPSCPRDMWDAEQQLLLAQHRATMPGCCRDINASEESATALLQLCTIQWPPQVDPALLALVRRVPPVIGEPLSPAQHDCSAISEALTWSHAEPIEGFLLAGARLARKQHNLRLAERWLLREAGSDEEGSSLTTLADDGAPLAVLRGGRQVAARSGRAGRGSLLTLAKWLQAEPPTVEPLLGDGLRNGHVDGLAAAFSCGFSLSGHQRNCSAPPPQLQPLDGLLSSSEMSMGSLLRHSLSLCPTLPKAWATYAGWCYRWGRKVIDAPSGGDSEDIGAAANEGAAGDQDLASWDALVDAGVVPDCDTFCTYVSADADAVTNEELTEAEIVRAVTGVVNDDSDECVDDSPEFANPMFGAHDDGEDGLDIAAAAEKGIIRLRKTRQRSIKDFFSANDGKLNISTKDNDLAYLLPDSLTEEEKSAAKRILMRVQRSIM
ncbi:hypothetical protein HPB52_025107 [Rhipicephalus sanguineus]|uniref:Uncharacterized protein n=1 Tax=Rhipicephalus sanguineus TaxID=34632 RepID=A0A9D4YRY6_RHISA|nr:hypothetical protein HPB52_025107 [Rhipicephalus sanguineus]